MIINNFYVFAALLICHIKPVDVYNVVWQSYRLEQSKSVNGSNCSPTVIIYILEIKKYKQWLEVTKKPASDHKVRAIRQSLMKR